jgi:hypothetical protein
LNSTSSECHRFSNRVHKQSAYTASDGESKEIYMPKWVNAPHTTNEANGKFEKSLILAKVPVCASGLSALIYFATSEGIRNYLAMLVGAFGKLMRLLH